MRSLARVNRCSTYTLGSQRATEGNITALIQGESGTGKELVAKAIHYNSSSKSRAFRRD